MQFMSLTWLCYYIFNFKTVTLFFRLSAWYLAAL